MQDLLDEVNSRPINEMGSLPGHKSRQNKRSGLSAILKENRKGIDLSSFRNEEELKQENHQEVKQNTLEDQILQLEK